MAQAPPPASPYQSVPQGAGYSTGGQAQPVYQSQQQQYQPSYQQQPNYGTQQPQWGYGQQQQ